MCLWKIFAIPATFPLYLLLELPPFCNWCELFVLCPGLFLCCSLHWIFTASLLVFPLLLFSEEHLKIIFIELLFVWKCHFYLLTNDRFVWLSREYWLKITVNSDLNLILFPLYVASSSPLEAGVLQSSPYLCSKISRLCALVLFYSFFWVILWTFN